MQLSNLFSFVLFSLFSYRNHTIALVKSSGKVFSFGQGTSGQLGTGALKNSSVPIVSSGNWLPLNALDDCSSGTPVDPGNVVKRVFAGGNCSFASAATPAMVRNSGSEVYSPKLFCVCDLFLFTWHHSGTVLCICVACKASLAITKERHVYKF